MTLYISPAALQVALDRHGVHIQNETLWGAQHVVISDQLAPAAGYYETEDGRRLDLVIDEQGLHPVRERGRTAR
jgi:hypothetical protein